MGTVNSGGVGMGLKVGADCRPTGFVNIPYGVTSINGNVFNYSSNITEVVISDTVTSILPKGDGTSDLDIFHGCNNLTKITVGLGLTSLPNSFFYTTYNKINTIIIKQANTNFYSTTFGTITSLNTFIVPNNFNPYALNLSNCTAIDRYYILEMFNKLVTIGTTRTLTLGATNLAKMTSAEKLIATNKGWTLA